MRLVLRSAAAALGITALAGCGVERRAEADLDDGARVSLTARAAGLDLLERRLIVAQGADRLEAELLADTGWWRGSNLYRHSSGVWLLHEGQSGCYAFDLSPPQRVFLDAWRESCSADTGWEPIVPSIVDPELDFIGHFSDPTSANDGLQFYQAEIAPERALPPPL